MTDLTVRDQAQLAVAQGQDAINALVIKGDTSKLTPEQKIQYYDAVCKSLGLNPATRPFDFHNFQATEDQLDDKGKIIKKGREGKEVLYPKKECAEQIRSMRGVSLSGPNFTFQSNNQVVICTITAKMRNGREDTDIGVVDRTSGPDKYLSLGNAMLKAVTKAKRRVTFSICGLGFLNNMADVVDEGAPLLVEDVPLAELHGVEYLTPEQFDALTEFAKAAQMTPKAFGLYLGSRYPNRSRGEIPAEDFDAIALELSDETVVTRWNDLANPKTPIE